MMTQLSVCSTLSVKVTDNVSKVIHTKVDSTTVIDKHIVWKCIHSKQAIQLMMLSSTNNYLSHT